MNLDLKSVALFMRVATLGAIGRAGVEFDLSPTNAIGELVEAGVGIGLAALWHVGPALREGRVVQVLPDFTVWPQRKIWAVRPSGRLTPVRVKVFLDFMEQRIKEVNLQRYGGFL